MQKYEYIFFHPLEFSKRSIKFFIDDILHDAIRVALSGKKTGLRRLSENNQEAMTAKNFPPTCGVATDKEQ